MTYGRTGVDLRLELFAGGLQPLWVDRFRVGVYREFVRKTGVRVSREIGGLVDPQRRVQRCRVNLAAWAGAFAVATAGCSGPRHDGGVVADESDSRFTTRFKDGREWRIGGASEVAWIVEATVPGLEITAAAPPAFAAYCTVVLPEHLEGAQRRHDRAVVALLAGRSEPQPWWLGYLETGIGAEVVFFDAPRVKLYSGWDYVLVQAGPEQAVSWRESEGARAPWKGALPDLMFPVDHSWLFSTLWDDHWSCIGGCEALVASFARAAEFGARTRTVALGEDATPPGHEPH